MINKDEDLTWKNETYKILESINKQIFTLNDVYLFELELQKKFPDNLHIKAKLRQQLQLLRDDGIIEFVDNRGTFRKVFETEEEKNLLNEVKFQIESNNFKVDDKWSYQKQRVGIQYFRKLVLRNFEYSCCICRFDLEQLLDAAHIISWKKDPMNRLNPSNGLSFCRIHHGAFDVRFLDIDSNLTIKISDDIKESENESVQSMIVRYDGEKIVEPKMFELLL